jgi:hypothetical protein
MVFDICDLSNRAPQLTTIEPSHLKAQEYTVIRKHRLAMYTLHYDDPHHRTEYFLSCERLALHISEWGRRPAGGAPGKHCRAADLNDDRLWAAAGRLHWALSSELTIDGDFGSGADVSNTQVRGGGGGR